MRYWRQESFQVLEDLHARTKNEPQLTLYAEYLQLLSKGLRKQALKRAEDFLSLAVSWDEGERRSVVARLCRLVQAEPGGHRYLPQPIVMHLVDPVIKRWIQEQPDDPEPLKWTGKIDDLRRSLTLDADCMLTRHQFVTRIIEHVDYDTHELPALVLGDAAEDLALLEEAAQAASRLGDEAKREPLLGVISEMRSAIETHCSTSGGKEVAEEDS